MRTRGCDPRPNRHPNDWASGREVLRDHGALPVEELEAVAGVVTGCVVAVAVAETGTVVLDGAPVQVRRSITPVPDLHVCVGRANQVVQTVPEAVRRLVAMRTMTWISGASATSDIELQRGEGVRGPRTLEVALVGSRC
jgi:L-lactate dehydrogenase complex protein LldG